MWVLKPTVSLCERKIWFAHAQESKHDLKCESDPLPFNCEPLSKIGRLLKWKLFQEPDGPQFIGQTAIFWGKSPGDEVGLYHADWFVAVDLLIFHILMIPNKDAPGSWQLSANSPVIWLCTWVRYWPGRGLVYVPTLSPGRANCY